jgi:nucleoside 2-deoxyribosyltransferase
LRSGARRRNGKVVMPIRVMEEIEMSETIFVASSKQFYPLAESIVARLKTSGVQVFHPYFHLDHQALERDPDTKATVTLQHFPEIDECDLLYALLPEGYIGCSVTIELSYAYAKGKRVVASEPPGEYAVRAMVSELCPPDEFVARYEVET